LARASSHRRKFPAHSSYAIGTAPVPKGLSARRQGTEEPHVYRTLLISTAALTAVTTARAESGLASYYGGIGHSGEMTCAHRTRPMGSMITVSYRGRSVRCRVNDRGPFVRGRVIDVSVGAARALGMMDAGVVRVSLESE
jgi:rare lipoprotein A